MAEPPTTAPPQAATPERDVLLATKLHVPRPRAGFLARPRLLERLTQETARELALVCAPAGFGKTTVLGDWARRSQRPVAWLSLDEGDNDPARFWRYVAAALDGVRPGIHQQVAALLRGPQPPLEAVVTVVVNELAAAPEEVVLVLDDYHLIEAPPVHHSLAFLLDRLPAGLRLAVASRSDPPLRLARLRARGQLAELRERDLRFTLQETATLLREATGLELPADSVAALAARTEGWVAGLQLAALSLSGRSDPAGFVQTFAGTHRFVLDYLTEEVLARQPEWLVRFLLETSVLERLCGPLCQAVTGRADSQTVLEGIERANLLLVPLDEERRWWRYHQLFADLLRARLHQQHPERVTQLHHATATWCQEHGLGDDAIRHALAAGDPQWAARLIEQHFDAAFRRAEHATMDRWLQALPAEMVRARPRLCLVKAYRAMIDGRLQTAERLLDDAERAPAAGTDEPSEPSVGRAASLIANAPAAIAVLRTSLARLHGDPERAIAFGQQALAHLTDADRALRSLLGWYLAAADWLRGRVVPAAQALSDVVAAVRATGERHLAMWPLYELGQVQQARGQLGAALRTYEQALAVAGDPGRALPPVGTVHVGMAEVLYQRGELDAALRHATQGIGLSRQLTYALPQAIGLAVLARIRQAQEDPAGAMETIGEAEQVMPDPGVTTLLNPVPAVAARLLLAHGRIADAARWTAQRGLDVEDDPSYLRERDHLVLARVLLAEQAPERALPLLERLHILAVAQERTGSVIEIQALRALGLAAAGDEPAALAALAEAFTLAAPEGYLRVFLDEGAPLAALFGKLATTPARVQAIDGVPRAHLGRLLEAFEQDGQAVLPRPRPGGAVAAGLVAPLSARELEVLQLLAAGKPNQVIAEELVITLHTVKRHVSHVLDKLGATNRTQAVSRARELGLLR